MVVLPPKPPPISAGITLMRVFSQPSMAAVDERTLKCPCEEHQIVVWPSWPLSATQAWGSM